MIEQRKEQCGWEFLFLGANIDAVAAAKSVGIGADRAVKYMSDSAGTRLNYEVMSEAISAVRCARSMALHGRRKSRRIVRQGENNTKKQGHSRLYDGNALCVF